MTLVEWYFNNGTSGLTDTVILPVTQWKYRFVSGAAFATGSSTVTTTTSIHFINSLFDSFENLVGVTTTSTATTANAQQYPAGEGNSYFSPLVANTLEVIKVVIDNSAGVDGNYILFAIEIDLDGDFDE